MSINDEIIAIRDTISSLAKMYKQTNDATIKLTIASLLGKLRLLQEGKRCY